MISIIPEYCNRNLLVKWINSHRHHTCVYMGTILFPFSHIIEQSKAPNSVSQSSPTHVFLFSFVTHREYLEVLRFLILTQWHARVSVYPRMEILSIFATHCMVVVGTLNFNLSYSLSYIRLLSMCRSAGSPMSWRNSEVARLGRTIHILCHIVVCRRVLNETCLLHLLTVAL
jgi:hypothetical protein